MACTLTSGCSFSKLATKPSRRVLRREMRTGVSCGLPPLGIENMHGARLPAKPHLRTRRKAHLAGRAHHERGVADARGDDAVGAMVFRARDGRVDAIAADADVLR